MERDTVLVHIYSWDTGELLGYYTTSNFSETLKAFHYMKYNDDISAFCGDAEGSVVDVNVHLGDKEMLTCINVYIRVY